MQFSPELRDRVADGTITVSYRLWSKPKVKVGGVYRSGLVAIHIDDIDLLPFSSITSDDLVQAGEHDLESLRRRAAHAGPISDDTLLYRVEFHIERVNTPSETVTAFLDGMHHSRRSEVEALRRAILAADAEITEQVKWNAPSFCSNGDDRVTFRLQPGDRVELILHRGAKKRTDAAAFTFTDPTGLVRWLAPDRGVVALADADDTERKTADIVRLVGAWIAATVS